MRRYPALLAILKGSWPPVLDHQRNHKRLHQSLLRDLSVQECLRGHPQRYSIIMAIELLLGGDPGGLEMIWSGCHIEVENKKQRCTSYLGYARFWLGCLCGVV